MSARSVDLVGSRAWCTYEGGVMGGAAANVRVQCNKAYVVGNGITVNTSGGTMGRITVEPGVYEFVGCFSLKFSTATPSSIGNTQSMWQNETAGQYVGARGEMVGNTRSYTLKAHAIVHVTTRSNFGYYITSMPALANFTGIHNICMTATRLDTQGPFKPVLVTLQSAVRQVQASPVPWDNIPFSSSNVAIKVNSTTFQVPAGTWEVIATFATTGNLGRANFALVPENQTSIASYSGSYATIGFGNVDGYAPSHLYCLFQTTGSFRFQIIPFHVTNGTSNTNSDAFYFRLRKIGSD